MIWFFKNSTYPFLEWRRKAYVLSATVLALGVGAMAVNLFTIGSWMNYGVDFTGGTFIQVRVADGTTDADMRAALGGTQAPSITRFGAENEFAIRAPLVEELETEGVAEQIRAQLEASSQVGEFEIVRTEIVGAVIGSELQARAGIAIFLSFLLTLIYIAFRFEFRFGLASVIATFHDILVILGFLALFRVEISLPTVAAVLTIIGYSLNDTIVVFDRIRENLNRKGGKREDPLELINRSINEVLPRTVITSGTTLLVLVALLVLGGAVIRDFTVVLILGIVVGTYSSVFVASPALLEIQKRFGTAEDAKRRKRQRAREKERKAIPV